MSKEMIRVRTFTEKGVNQYIINTNNGTYFQSYDSLIVFIDNNGKVTLDIKLWNYSTTTGKYRNLFLNETKKETLAKINSGEYKLDDLNG